MAKPDSRDLRRDQRDLPTDRPAGPSAESMDPDQLANTDASVPRSTPSQLEGHEPAVGVLDETVQDPPEPGEPD